MLPSQPWTRDTLRGSLIPRMPVPATVVASAVAEQGPAYWPGLLDHVRLALRTQRLSPGPTIDTQVRNRGGLS